MSFLVHIHALTVGVAISYLTLLMSNSDQAASLIWPYATVMLVLAVGCLASERRHRHRH